MDAEPDEADADDEEDNELDTSNGLPQEARELEVAIFHSRRASMYGLESGMVPPTAKPLGVPTDPGPQVRSQLRTRSSAA